MYITRVAEKTLQKSLPAPKIAILLGARQVGKSYLVETFGRENFESLVTVNFDANPE